MSHGTALFLFLFERQIDQCHENGRERQSLANNKIIMVKYTLS